MKTCTRYFSGPMAHCHCNLLVTIAAVVLFLAVGAEASGGIVGFNLHHRFSPVVRQWMEARGHGAPSSSWLLPEEAAVGSPEYYSALLRHDHAHFTRRRGLADTDGQSTLTFADGNATHHDNHTYLHYAEVEVGTPSSKFLVALDTGSDLFWLPCECKLCSRTGDTTYSPRLSSTSKTVPCGHPLCERPDVCAAAAGTGSSSSSSCPYEVKYVSANTGSSGVLVEDVLHLVSGAGKAVQAPIVFGCGQVQTGTFLRGAADGGLMGLGMDKVSVPSELASSGIVPSDSFSMCFSRDGVGRINFGDAGSPDQAETPVIPAGSLQYPFYNISVGGITVDSKAMAVEFTAIVDSGTSFTYLNDPAYTFLTTNFNSRVSEARYTFGNGWEQFDYCYSLSPGQTSIRRLPAMSLTTKGGAVFPVTWPIIPVRASTNGGAYYPIGYCLGIMKTGIFSTEDATIGQNFMTGLKVVFDRRRSVLGWEKFDCYKDAKMQDSGSPDTSLGSPAAGDDDSAPASPNGDYVPYVPLPRYNATNEPYYPGSGRGPMTWPASSGSGLGSGSSRASFGGLLSMILLHVLVIISVAW